MNNKNKLGDINGLTKELLNFFDFKTINLKDGECYCEINIKNSSLDKNGNFDEGLLIALIDTFSSYAVLFLTKEDYKKYLSVNITMFSFDEIKKEKNSKLKMKVYLIKKEGRNILLKIQIYNEENKEIKTIYHLKRSIKPKY
jgi:predicted aspartyl protease